MWYGRLSVKRRLLRPPPSTLAHRNDAQCLSPRDRVRQVMGYYRSIVFSPEVTRAAIEHKKRATC